MGFLDSDLRQQRWTSPGEDTCELFATIEDSFGVEFGEYSQIMGATVKHLAEIIGRDANYPSRDKCLNLVAFYRLRSSIRALFGTKRSVVRTDTSVRNLLPWKTRRVQWKALEDHLGLTLPGLTYSRPLLGLSLIFPLICCGTLKVVPGIQPSVVAFIGTFLTTWILSLFALTPLARSLPTNCESLGGLTKILVARNYFAFASMSGSSSEEEIVAALRLLIATEMGLGLNEITPETRIPDDLSIY